MIKFGEFQRELICELTDAEKIACGEKTGRLTLELGQLQEEHSAQKKVMASQEKEMGLQISDLSRVLAEGKEKRLVDCVAARDHDRAIVTVTRCDTGEVIEQRPFTNAEMALPLDDDPEEERIASMDAEAEEERKAIYGQITGNGKNDDAEDAQEDGAAEHDAPEQADAKADGHGDDWEAGYPVTNGTGTEGQGNGEAAVQEDTPASSANPETGSESGTDAPETQRPRRQRKAQDEAA